MRFKKENNKNTPKLILTMSSSIFELTSLSFIISTVLESSSSGSPKSVSEFGLAIEEPEAGLWLAGLLLLPVLNHDSNCNKK